MAEIIPIKDRKGYERHTRMSAAVCLREAKARKPKEILVIGHDENGDLFVNGSPPDPGNALWLMAMATRRLTGG